MKQLTMAATGRDVDIRFDDNLHDISLQGPLAVDFLEKQGVPGIRDLAYFSHTQTMLWDKPVMIFAHRLYRRARIRDFLPRARCRGHLGCAG